MKLLFPEAFGNYFLSYGLYICAVIAFVESFSWAGAAVHGHACQSKQTRHLAQQPGARVARTGNDVEQQAPTTRTAIAILSVPQVGISALVVEGVEGRDRNAVAGQILGAALPGEPAILGIAGDKNTLFKPLHLLQENDVIALTTQLQQNQYRVVSNQIVGQDDVQSLRPTGPGTLFLVTSFPVGQQGVAPESLVIRAERITKYSSN